MPAQPPRSTPGRGPSRPGGGREPRPVNRLGAKGVSQADKEKDKDHGDARARIVSTLALGVTHRVIAIGAVFAVLAVSFVSSLSVYFGQQHDIAATKEQIALSQEAVDDIEDRIARWQDPAYVEAQARDQLGWVMPGEISYRVIDAEGNVIGGVVSPINPSNEEVPRAWYEALWGSVQAADRPEPVPTEEPTTPAAPSTIGPDSQPTPR